MWEEGDCWAKTKETDAITKRKRAMRGMVAKGGRVIE